MKTLNVSISDVELKKFGIKKQSLFFTELVDLISREIARQNLEKSVALAEKYGLFKMTMDEILNEVKDARKGTKNNS
jgi:hypothetical protein